MREAFRVTQTQILASLITSRENVDKNLDSKLLFPLFWN